MRHFSRVMRGIERGGRWNMAVASYSYSRMHGLTYWEALVGAWGLFWDETRAGEG